VMIPCLDCDLDFDCQLLHPVLCSVVADFFCYRPRNVIVVVVCFNGIHLCYMRKFVGLTNIA
jgi:hypothetical protein